jgi:PAS domain S-box-containing protein
MRVKDEPEGNPPEFLPWTWNALPFGVLIVKNDGLICLVNQAVERLSGLPSGEMIGKPVSVLDRGTCEHRLEDLVQATLVSGVPAEYVTDVRRKDGRLQRELRKTSLISGPDGDACCVVTLQETSAAVREEPDRQHRFERIIEQADAGYFRIGMDGCFADVNRAWLRMHSLERKDQIVGHHFTEVQTPEDSEEAKKIVNCLLRGERIESGEFTRRRSDGSVGYHSYSVTPIYEDEHVVGLEGFLFDVTERRIAERERQRSELLYRSLFDAMNEGVAVHRLVREGGEPVNYLLLDVNRRFEQIVGIPGEQAVNRLATDVYKTEEAAYLGNFVAAVNTQSASRFEAYFSPLQKHFVISVAPIEGDLFATIFFDVTVQKTTERQYREIFEGAIEGIYRVTADGRSLAANAALARILGYERPEDLVSVITDAANQMWLEPAERTRFVQLVEKQGVVRGYECQLVRRDGTPIWVSISSRRVTGDDGETAYLEGFVEDIDERKRTELELRKALEDLQRNEEILHLAQRAAHFGVFDWDAKTGKSRWSREAYELYGLNPDTVEASGEAWLQTVHPNDRERILSEFHASLGSASGELQIEYLAADGMRWIAGIGQLFRDAGGKPDHMTGINIDITQRKRIEQRLERREAEQSALFEALETAIIMLDVDASRVIYANPAYLALNGLEHEDLSRITQISDWTTDWEMLYSDGRQMPLEDWPVSRMLRGQELRGAEMICRSLKTKREYSALWSGAWVRNAAGEKIAIALSATDISELKRIQEALRKSEEKFVRIFRASPAASALTEFTADGPRMFDVNEALERMTGYTRDEVIQSQSLGRDIWVEPAEWQKAYSSLSADGRIQNFEYRFRRKKGDVGTGLISAEIIEIEGKPCVLSSTIDITDRVELERRFLQAQKLESIGRLAGGVAHDFNNLLTVINGYSGFLLKDLNASSLTHSYADEIRKAGERAAGLTKQLLAFSRKQICEPRPLDLNTIIRDSEGMLRRLIAEDITLAANLDPLLGQVMADPTQIHQVVMNLVVNARDAMPDGGVLDIETSNQDLTEGSKITHPEAKSGHYVVLTVTDTGMGMDDETRERIFEPFFTTKAAEHGSGLGLSTVYGIVRQSGGWIDVWSRVGLGTSFKLFFPRIDSEPAIQQGSKGSRTAARTGETVLVVEDQEPVRALIAAVLQNYGYQVLQTGSADSAISIARGYPGQLHLLLTDVVLPGMNGRDLADELSSIRPQIKVLFTSGYTADVIAHRGVLETGVAFIPKPFTEQSLALKVREVLGAN